MSRRSPVSSGPEPASAGAVSRRHRTRIFWAGGALAPGRLHRVRGTARMWKRAAIYGAALAAGTFALQWLDYQRLARAHSGEVYDFLVAVAFLALGIFLGARLFGASGPAAFDGNPKARASLGISPRAGSRCSSSSRPVARTRRSRPSSMYPPTPSRPTWRGCSRSSARAGARRRSTGHASSGSCRRRRRFGVIRVESPVWRMAVGSGEVANSRTIV